MSLTPSTKEGTKRAGKLNYVGGPACESLMSSLSHRNSRLTSSSFFYEFVGSLCLLAHARAATSEHVSCVSTIPRIVLKFEN